MSAGEEHAIASGSEAERMVRVDRVRMSGQAPDFSTGVLLRQGNALCYEIYRTKSLPSACRMALLDHPGGEVLQTRRVIELADDPVQEAQAA